MRLVSVSISNHYIQVYFGSVCVVAMVMLSTRVSGLCFSVLPGVAVPPSLQNMYKELETDIPGFQTPSHGYLMGWAGQGW